MNLDRIIQHIRENMVANAPGTGGGFSATSDAQGPVAGNSYKLPNLKTFRRNNKKRYIYQKNTRKNWM